MNYFRELFKVKDKKTAVNIVAALIIGIILLALSSSLFSSPQKENSAVSNAPASLKENAGQLENASDQGYEEELEKRLEASLSQIYGIGKVKVMLTLSYGREIVVAEDKTASESRTSETDSQGGSRSSITSDITEKKIIVTNEEGIDAPIVLREIKPKVEGVIIIAEGGDDVFAKDALINAAKAVLGLEADKIQVFKMKK
ncbi:MAG: hypothetical protein LBU32_11770 [Clostridiales bacterium]|jgi:stage III sporulation protein AG|nr:hypothetical protein [Clostridiales bacterium]